jgi:phosphate transport system substrate-binding protein
MKRMILHNVLMLLSLMIILFTPASGIAEVLRIGAGAAPTENILKPIRSTFEKASGMSLSIISNGPKQAFIELEKGSLDAAAAGLSFNDWINLLLKEGVPVADSKSYSTHLIGKDRVIVLLHKDNTIASLSKEQLIGLFSGKIQNWKEVGGKDMSVLIVWGSLIPGTNSMFTKVALDGATVSKEVLDATTAEDVREKIRSNPEAIGIGPQAALDSTVWSPKTPEVARDITLITKGVPSAKVQKLLDFIKGDSAKLIK